MQVHHVEGVAPALASVANQHDVVVTHGNGPQVGLLAIESADDTSLSRPYPLDALVAETQGMIGYWLQRSLNAAGLDGPVVSLVTQTLVDPSDPAFASPTKFVGPSYAEDEAQRPGTASRGWTMAPEQGRQRRVVRQPGTAGGGRAADHRTARRRRHDGRVRRWRRGAGGTLRHGSRRRGGGRRQGPRGRAHRGRDRSRTARAPHRRPERDRRLRHGSCTPDSAP